MYRRHCSFSGIDFVWVLDVGAGNLCLGIDSMNFPDSPGNKLFLFCSGCQLEPFELARRRNQDYEKSRTLLELGNWFDRHSECPNGPDKFKLAHQFSPNYDVPMDAEPVPNAVRLALVNGK
jgi:hypothetical protein